MLLEGNLELLYL